MSEINLEVYNNLIKDFNINVLKVKLYDYLRNKAIERNSSLSSSEIEVLDVLNKDPALDLLKTLEILELVKIELLKEKDK